MLGLGAAPAHHVVVAGYFDSGHVLQYDRISVADDGKSFAASSEISLVVIALHLYLLPGASALLHRFIARDDNLILITGNHSRRIPFAFDADAGHLNFLRISVALNFTVASRLCARAEGRGQG